MHQTRLLLIRIFIIAILGGIFLSTKMAYANILGNPGFEAQIGSGTESNWDSTNSSVRVNSSTVTGLGFTAPPEGSFALRLDAAGDFTFQTNDNVHAGDLVTLSARGESDVAAGSGGQLRIEFKRIKLDGTDELISATNDDVLVNTATAAAGGGYVLFSMTARAPEGTGRVVFVLRGQGAFGGGNVIFDSVNGEVNPAAFHVFLSRPTVRVGEVVGVTANIRNESGDTFTGVQLHADIPSGFTILPETIRENGQKTDIQEGSTIIRLGNVVSGELSQVTFLMLATSGVVPGKVYEMVFRAISGDGRISEVSGITIRVKGDPVFDEGVIIGKVFDDRDEDGAQSKGEMGVPRVRIYTDYGVSVITDAEGRFHIPAVQPGRHVLKIDGHTLPQGTTFVTEESLLIKTTPGLLNKVRFAVRLSESALPPEFLKGLHVWVTQGIDLARPQLGVSLEPDILKAGLGRLEREPTFHIKTNYAEFISGWQLEIWDEMGEKIWTGFGISKPPTHIPWNGLTDNGELIRPGIYGYRLVVRDNLDHEDWTPMKFLRVIQKSDSMKNGDGIEEIPSVGSLNMFRDGRRGIPLVGKPTVRVYGKTEPGRRVLVEGVPVEPDATGEFEQELFVSPGNKAIVTRATNVEGDTISIEEKLEVKDSSFFLVALGEEEVGFNAFKGNQETVARDDKYHEDFYEDGKLSYYLKAKVKGKFLVKSHYNTDDKRTDLFTHLDPDDYYPVYGDYSQLDFEGQETQERLFILVEMDRSFLKWGSYETNFQDTELARYNRTLSGLKIHHESLSSTKYGDAKRAFSVFWSKPNYIADHNEFRATGGSLYYLRQRNVVSGSEKIRVEIRDKIQDIPIESRDLVAGKDYEIDIRQGRILLKEPLSSVAASETIISNDILDGNPVYLMVDYEYEVSELFEDTNEGIRAYTHIGDHVRIGGTAVEEKRVNADYDLRAVDGVFRIGKRTKVTAEFGQAKLRQVRQGISFDGGLSFRRQSVLPGRRPREKAYLVKAESKPFQPLDVTGYLQDVEPGFSIDRIKSQEGFRKYGLQSKLKLSPHFHLMARHDSTEVVSQLRPLDRFSLSTEFEKLRSTTAQAVFDYGRWNVIGEYLHQRIDVPLQSLNRTASFFSEKPFGNALGMRVARRVTDSLTPYLKGQMTLSGKQNFQLGGGFEAKAGKQTKIYYEQMFGSVGDSAQFGLSTQKDSKTTSYASIKVQDNELGANRVSTHIGSSHQLSEKSRIYSEREYSTYTGNLPLSFSPTFVTDTVPPAVWSSDIYGYETRPWDRWDFGLRFERRHLTADDFRSFGDLAIDNFERTNTFNTLSGSLGYNDSKKWKWEDSLEVRIEPDAPEVRQWVTQNSIEWKVNKDLSFLGRANFGTSRLVEPGDLTGRFFEFNTGFAYRPVDSDRFNWLARYTLFREEPSDAQASSAAGLLDEQAHLLSLEGGYELTQHLQVVEKFSYRIGKYKNATLDWVGVDTFLWVNRFNYHVTRKWDLALEYRMLFQFDAADSLRHGPLVEIDRELSNYVRLGIGYNFTDFDDDLRRTNDFRKHGVFVRLSGKV